MIRDIAAERAVLAGVFKYKNDCFVDIEPITKVNSFTDGVNQVLWKVLEKVYEADASTELDLPLILSTANELGCSEVINKPSEIGYIQSLFQTPIERKNVIRMALKMEKFSLARQGTSVAQTITENLQRIRGDETFDQLISSIEGPVYDFVGGLSGDKKDKTVLLHEGLGDWLDEIEAAPVEQIGVSTGFKLYDKVIGGGLGRGGVYVIGARAKQGKSLWTDNVGIHVSSQLKVPVLNLDTEMTQKKHWYRVLANMTSIDMNLIKTGQYSLDEAQRIKVRGAAQTLEKVPYSYHCVAGMDFDDIISIARRWAVKDVGIGENGERRDCVLILDYIKMMGQSKDMKEFEALGYQLMKLHDFCVKYDLPCLTFVQLNREGIDEETTAVISGSDRISFYCDSFSIFKRKTPEEIAEDGKAKGNRKLVPVIARDGEEVDWGAYINYRLTGEYGRLEELSAQKEDLPQDEIESCPF